MKDDFREQLAAYIEASFPIIHINTLEYDRALEAVIKCFNSVRPDYSVFLYNSALGIFRHTAQGLLIPCNKTSDIETAFGHIMDREGQNAVLITRNLEGHLSSSRKWRLIDLLLSFYHKGIADDLYLVDIGPLSLCRELSNYVISLDFHLPSFDEIKETIKLYIKESGIKGLRVDGATIERACELCQGMSLSEIEGAVAISLRTRETLDLSVLQKQKSTAVRKSGLLEWIQDVPSIDEIGGLEIFKQWCSRIAKAYSSLHRARKFGLAIPKGCLLVGIPGTGKTLSAKAISSLFGVPLYRLDIGKLYSSFIGETEHNMRFVLTLIDALAPCVILIDEVEKAFAGVHSSSHVDSGTTARVFASFLYYMQEKKTAAFFVCTANDVSKLPPEFLRKGRFDEIWYVGLPSIKERESIWKIHLDKVGRKPAEFDLKALSKASDGFAGAEIERAIQEALYEAYYHNTDITTESLLSAVQNITPLSISEADKIQQIEEWAIKNHIRRANASGTSRNKRKNKK